MLVFIVIPYDILSLNLSAIIVTTKAK